MLLPGRVLAFVHGYSTTKVRERVETVSLIKGGLPDGLSPKYIENLNALYSLGIKLDRVRGRLEALGVTL